MREPVVSPDFLRSFVPPPELARSRPRDVRLTGGGRAVTIVIWLAVVAAIGAGLALNAEARRQAARADSLRDNGAVTLARVDRVWRKTGDGNPAYAAFHFDASGTRVDGQSRMRMDVWRTLQPGATLPVRYLPDDPGQWALEGSRGGRMPVWVAYLVSGSLLAIALLCGAVLRGQRRLLSEGRPAPAVVTKVSRHQTSHGASHRVVEYEFPLLGGGQAKGRTQASRKPQLAVGATICIVYDPDRPNRSAPYPFSLVTPDTGEFR